MKKTFDVVTGSVGLAFSILALAIVAIRALPSRAQGRMLEQGTLEGRLQTLEETLKKLEIRINGEHENNTQVVPAPVEFNPEGPAGASEDCDAKVAAIEGEIEEIKTELISWQASVALSNDREPRRTVPTTEELSLVDTDLARRSIARYQEIFMNESLELHSRLRALNVLRLFPAGAGAVDPIADEVFNLLVYTDDNDLEGVVEACKGTKSESIANGLVHVLDNSQVDEVRWEAVRALQGYLHLTQVVASLERAAAREPGSSQRAAQGILAVYYAASEKKQ